MDEKQKEELKNKALDFANWAKKKTIEAGKIAVPVAKVVAKKAAQVGLALADQAGKVANEMERKHADRVELEKEENTWYTAAPAPVIFENLYKHFSTTIFMPMPQNRWRSIRPVPEYLQIFFEAGWEEQSQSTFSIGGGSYTHQTTISMNITIEPLDNGNTSVAVKYQKVINNLIGNDPVASELIRYTNQRIRNLCWQCPANDQPDA